ncbi:MAG TPA: type II secretion system F family protein [candidate division Zixibacteria bacterium]|nr:type II secretion system F family protein [candidate division Zixibacteria bacterium]
MDPLILLLGAAALLMVMGAGVALILGGRSNVEERLDQYVGSGGAAPVVVEKPSQPRDTIVADRIEKAIAGRGFTDGIKSRIAKADAKLRVSEYIAIQVLSAFAVGAAIYFIFGKNLIFATLGAIFGLFLPRMYLSFAAKRRLRAFENQLSDTLNLWVNALRSGYSVLQAMEAIATELPPPVSVEFERVVQEVRLGLTVPAALGNMLRRVPSDDLDLVITAVNIQREVGGNLAEVLDTISFTIRERVRIKGEIRTLTAQGRLSGWIISLLPIGLALVLLMINPSYMGQLFANAPPFLFGIPCGWIVVGVGLVMMTIGIIIIQKIVDIEV